MKNAGRRRWAAVGGITALALPVGAWAATTGTATLSVPVGGKQPNAPPLRPVRDAVKILSPGGGPGASTDPVPARSDPDVAAFASTSDNLVPGDGNGVADAFVNDDGKLTRISGDLPGERFTGLEAGPSICGSGDVVAYAGGFQAAGDGTPVVYRVVMVNRRTGVVTPIAQPSGTGPSPRVSDVVLSPDCTVVAWVQDGDIWISDLRPGGPGPVLVSADPAGNPVGGSSDPRLGDQGACVAFVSDRSGLIADDTNGVHDVFLRTGVLTPDAADDGITRLSRDASGGSADGPSSAPDVTPDCRTVVFSSLATDLVEDDGNGTGDVFKTDVTTGTITAVTVGDGPSGEPSISGDGRYVAFSSAADDLVPGDTNGPNPRGLTPTNFSVLDRAGRLTYAASIVEVDGARVRVAFPGDVSGFSGAAVEGGALIDDQTLPLAAPDGRSNTNPPAILPLTLPDKAPPRGPNGIIDGPDLVSAEAVADDNGTPSDTADDAPTVRFCFDQPLVSIAGTATGDPQTGNRVATEALTLTGYNSAARRSSVQARLADGDPACVLAAFPAGVDPARFTLAIAAPGTVTDPAGRTNVRQARPLQGRRLAPQPGDVTGPNLRSVTPDSITSQARFLFDAIAGTVGVAADAGTAARFGFLDQDGRLHPGQAIAGVDATSVTVQFASDADPLSSARRFVVPAGTVINGAGEPNVDQATDGDVPGPELVSVTRVGNDLPPQYDFTFNASVAGPDAGRLFLLSADGTRFPVASTSQPKPTVVRVAAPNVERFAGRLVLGMAAEGAVYGDTAPSSAKTAGVGRTAPASVTSGPPNPLGTAELAQMEATAGTTDGPDLLQTIVVEEFATQIDYFFDGPVTAVNFAKPDAGFTGLPTDVFVVDQDTGEVVRASVATGGNEVDGSSSHPSISDTGGKVLLHSVGPLTGDTDKFPDTFSVNLVRADPSVSDVDFGAWPVSYAAPDSRSVGVVNGGLGPLPIKDLNLAGANADDFTVTGDGCSGVTLQPKDGCVVVVSFKPGAEGRRVARLDVTADEAPKAPSIRLGGRGTVPTVRLSPGVGPTGTVALATGVGFPPGAAVELRWIRNVSRPVGPKPIPFETTVFADDHGNLVRTPIPIVSGDVEGPRTLQSRTEDGKVTRFTPFLVVPPTYAPGGIGPTGPGDIPFLIRRD